MKYVLCGTLYNADILYEVPLCLLCLLLVNAEPDRGQSTHVSPPPPSSMGTRKSPRTRRKKDSIEPRLTPEPSHRISQLDATFLSAATSESDVSGYVKHKVDVVCCLFLYCGALGERLLSMSLYLTFCYLSHVARGNKQCCPQQPLCLWNVQPN